MKESEINILKIILNLFLRHKNKFAIENGTFFHKQHRFQVIGKTKKSALFYKKFNI